MVGSNDATDNNFGKCAVYAMALCLSVYLSVCLSVTSLCFIETAKRLIVGT